MRLPVVRLRWLLALLGWVLVLGGCYETIYLLHEAWSFPTWDAHTLILRLLRGPAVHLGLGVALWSLRRL